MNISILNGSECYVPFAALNVSGAPFTPSSLSYTVTDTTNNILVVSPTTVPIQQAGTITLSATVNTMNAASLTFEDRTVTLKIGIPGGTYQNIDTTYSILRAPGTP